MNKATFEMFKNIIIEQNKELLRQVAKITGKDEQILMEKYIKPDFYLPIILKSNSNNGEKTKTEKISLNGAANEKTNEDI